MLHPLPMECRWARGYAGGGAGLKTPLGQAPDSKLLWTVRVAGQREVHMEELVLERGPSVDGVDDRTPVAWRDLRDWLKLVEQAGQLKRVNAPVDPDEELGAVTFMVGRTPETPALLFDNLVGNRSDARILSNM